MKKIVSFMVLTMFMLTFAASAAEVKTEAKAAAENATKKVEVAGTAAEKKVEAAGTAAEKKVAETKEAAATKTAEAAQKKTPGFEGIFAIAGLMAVAYLVLGRK